LLNLKILKQLNYPLLIVTLTILIIGIFFIYSASYQITLVTNAEINYAAKQVVWSVISLIVFFLIIFFLSYDKIKLFTYPLFIVNIVTLLIVLAFGSERYGAQRWLSIGGFILQPSEFAKLTFILALAKLLSSDIQNHKSIWFIIKPLILSFIPIILILKQPDLGTTLTFFPVLFAMLFVAGASIKYLSILLISGVSALPFFWILLKEYQKNRIRVFWDPNMDPTGLGYQSIQSKIAVGSGGLFGKGWLHGTQNQLNFLPKRYTDFIFSVVGEEWGFIGVCIVLALYLCLVIIGLYIASKSKDTFGKLLGIGISIMILGHVMINTGMTVGLTPITGLPLLMLSYGGSSVLTAMISIALLESIWIKRKYDF